MRPCLLGNHCQARRVPHSRGPITLREWLYEGEWQAYQRDGTLPAERNLCIMCTRFLVNKVWQRNKNDDHRASTEDSGGVYKVAQPHYCVVDQPGQYRRSRMIHPTPGHTEGIVRPFPLHDLSDYLEDDRVLPGQPPGFRERGELFFR